MSAQEHGISIGRIVLFRSRTGKYTCPAIITCTTDSVNPEGVAAGHVPALSSDTHVHLTVFTSGKPGMRESADNFLVEGEHGRSENVAGCYQEWDVPMDKGEVGLNGDPGTWAWPPRI